VIGFLGGSFDPIHYGHLKNASIVKEELGLDELYLMPCSSPAQKSRLMFSNKERLDMIKLATNEFIDLSIDPREINRNGTSYTIDSLLDIRGQTQKTGICFLVGMDCYVNLNTWKNYQEFHNYCHLIVIGRPNYHTENKELHFFKNCSNVEQLHEQQNGLVYFSKSEMLDISSSSIRNKINHNQSLSNLVPSPVINYIEESSET